jgi:hypothetical protein
LLEASHRREEFEVELRTRFEPFTLKEPEILMSPRRLAP